MSKIDYNKYTSHPTELPASTVRYRSTLEARWALYFDVIGIQSVYEPKKFKLSSDIYIPDFYLPDVNNGCWVEVKPAYPDRDQIERYQELARLTKKDVILLTSHSVYAGNNGYKKCGTHYRFTANVPWKNEFRFCKCATCLVIGITYRGKTGELSCECNNKSRLACEMLTIYAGFSNKLLFTKRKDGVWRMKGHLKCTKENN